MKAKIYLDFNSTHPPDMAALAVAREFYFTHFANSSGLSLESQAVNKRIEETRAEVAGLIGVAPEQVIFTSCATESNNLLIRYFHANRKEKIFRVLSSPLEHPSVAETLRLLPDTEVTFLKTDKNGSVDTAVFTATDFSEFELVTMMAVQNESGGIMPLAELMNALPGGHPPVIADFSQALPKLAHNAPAHLRPDLPGLLTRKNFFLTATGHKVGAGFGAGLIVAPQDSRSLTQGALFAGGNQEFGARAGSHNAEAIVAFGAALRHKLAGNDFEKWTAVTRAFETALLQKISLPHAATVVGSGATRAPGTTLLLLPGIAIDFLIMALDKAGITVSTGTSCKSRSRSPSAALIAMGYSESESLSVVRFSYDQNLGAAEIAFTAEQTASAVAKLR